MRLLVDACVARGAVFTLRAAGHDVISVAEAGTPAADSEVLAMARRQRRILITLDKDFGTLVFTQGHRHFGIVRLAGLPPEAQGPLCIPALATHAVQIQRGGFVTVQRGRVRLRRGR